MTTPLTRKWNKGYVDSRVRDALCRWKQLYFEDTINTIKDLEDTNFHSGENSNIKRRQILEARVEMLFKWT